MSGRQFYRITCATLVASALYFLAADMSPLRAQTASNVICNGCVGGSDIANFAVSAGKLSTNSVSNPKIVTGAVTQGKIANGAVTGPKIANFSVSAGKLSINSITNPKIAFGAVTSGKLASGAQPAGADSASAGLFGDISLAAADAVIAAVTVTAPAAGRVIVTGSGYFDFNAVNGDARCSVTTGNTIFSILHIRATGSSGVHRYVPMAQTRAFTVPGPGSVTYNLVCDELSGNVQIADVSMTAIYVPQAY